MGWFHGRTALVTGGGSGIGRAIALELAAAGCRVAVCGRREQPLSAVAEAAPGAKALVVDVRDAHAVFAAVETVVAEFGQLDLLVNNAGVFVSRPFAETEIETFDDVIATNLRGPFLFAQAAWPHLAAMKGQVAMISSIAAMRAFPGSSAYCASKFGLNGLAAVLGLEGAEHGIRVVTVCPGAVDTEVWAGLADDEARSRMIRPEEVARITLSLLAADRAVGFEPLAIDNSKPPFNS
jgi:NAD(P)-dependent dehydrogenase (short-subunit alcohol dehydrogenase family)